ncbi:hypothetical protein BOTCAL_0395g00100 [Botryotinia calthae]|uniref:Uncharacterized protein n=1 Tax=Botryotinia calthae TaxID=38488 RepID=A0A4Y8CTD3_9HELO|nr:hypothetical protein BOTCAL_0395g00100 [Botryotinia calthae]
MPGLFNLPTPKLGMITDPAIDIANSVNDRNIQILEHLLNVIIMFGIGSGLVMIISISALLVVQIYRILRPENVKTAKSSHHSPSLQEGVRFLIDQKNGMSFVGGLNLDELNHYKIIIEEARDQESVVIPSSTLENAEILNDRKKAKREMRKAEEECEYQRFMGRFSTEDFASFVCSEENRSINENRA